jgi:cathepsin A (carboxypeptidase C)
MSLLVALLAITAGMGLAAPDADAVPSLPLWGAPPSRMWSGFLDAGAAEPGTMLHYW